MRIRTRWARAAALATTAAVAASLAACSSGGAKDSGARQASAPATSASTAAPSGELSATPSAPAGSASPAPGSSRPPAGSKAHFGPGCATVPTNPADPGSFAGMARLPVITAASHNRALGTLVTAVTAAGLGDTLNKAKHLTVFAPTNDAFGRVPQSKLDKVFADRTTLTRVLTHHVVARTITPDQLATAGTFTALDGRPLRVTGSGQDFTVGGGARIVCGGIRTANATVYLIDGVLMS